MISQSQKQNIEHDMITPNGLSNICSTSRRTIQRMADRDLLSPSLVDESGRKYYSFDDAMLLNIILHFEKYGMNSADIKKLLHNTIDKNVIDELFNHLKSFLLLLEADRHPFSFFQSGNIVSLSSVNFFDLMSNCYKKDGHNEPGWDCMLRLIHESLSDVFQQDQSLLYAIIYVEVDFREDGTPLTKNIFIPLKRKNTSTVPSTPGISLYAAWYGSVEVNHVAKCFQKYCEENIPTQKPDLDSSKGPASAFEQLRQKAEKMGMKPRGDYYLRFTRDFYSSNETDFDIDAYMYLEMPLLP